MIVWHFKICSFIVCLPVYVCMYAYVCACVCARECTFICRYIPVKKPKVKVCVLLHHSSVYLFIFWDRVTEPDSSWLAGLVSQQVPWVLLPLPPWPWNYRHYHTNCFVYVPGDSYSGHHAWQQESIPWASPRPLFRLFLHSSLTWRCATLWQSSKGYAHLLDCGEPLSQSTPCWFFHLGTWVPECCSTLCQ